MGSELLRRFKDQDLKLSLLQNLLPPRAALEKALRVWVVGSLYRKRGSVGAELKQLEQEDWPPRPTASVDHRKPGRSLQGCPQRELPCPPGAP